VIKAGAVTGKPDVPSITGKYSLRIDWRAYFERFCKEHGPPVLYKGNYLFQDGYRYATDSHVGPEWKPPEDKDLLLTFKRAYWKRRKVIISRELFLTRDKYERLVDAQAARSVPLQQSRSYYTQDEMTGKQTRVIDTYDLDLEGMVGRIQWLETDLTICDEELENLRSEEERVEDE